MDGRTALHHAVAANNLSVLKTLVRKNESTHTHAHAHIHARTHAHTNCDTGAHGVSYVLLVHSTSSVTSL